MNWPRGIRADPPSVALFDRWAEEYDTQDNPLLSLEERVVEPLIPSLRSLDALDAGCGTGRSFRRLRACDARTVIGVDSSPAMLERAGRYKWAAVRLGSCTSLPLPEDSVDFTVSSFVLGYIDSLPQFVSELKRVSRAGARVIVSDIHSETAKDLCWKRTFRIGTSCIEIPSNLRSIREIIDVFSAGGWSMTAQIECPFSTEEQKCFERAGKIAMFSESVGRPAIYVLSFVLDQLSIDSQLSITGAHCALSAMDRVPQTVSIVDRKMTLGAGELVGSSKRRVQLDGYVILPGLINAHDHLQFALFPRMGRGPYKNAGEWASDIHRNETEGINIHRAIPQDARMWWGGVRNLLCGVTTVCHHDSLSPRMREDDFPVSVVEPMAWAHSLMFEQDVGARSESADLVVPFVLHAAEGTDAKSAAEVEELDRLGVLNDRAVVVHGLALDETSLDRLNARQASLVCCPSSNDFLFHQVPSKDILRGINSLALGSDSPLTAIGDLLDELRYVREHIGLSARELYRMVLMSPARMLRLRNGEGRLMPGGVANIIATRDTGQEPAETLAGMSWREVELVVRGGRVFLASDEVYQRLPHSETKELVRLCVEGEARWIRAPLAWLFAETSNVARHGTLSLGGKGVGYG